MVEQPKLDRIEGLAFLGGKQAELFSTLRHVLLQPHPVIVKPVADASGFKVQLLAEEVHSSCTRVGLQGEGNIKCFLLLITEEDALLLGRSWAVHLIGVHVGGVSRGGSVRARVHTPFSLAQVVVLPLSLEGLQLLDVVGIVEPQLHPDERLAALDAEHVPRLWLREQFAHGALRQS